MGPSKESPTPLSDGNLDSFRGMKGRRRLPCGGALWMRTATFLLDRLQPDSAEERRSFPALTGTPSWGVQRLAPTLRGSRPALRISMLLLRPL